MDALEAMDRRLFLKGLTVTSAGLVIPRAVHAVVRRDDAGFIEWCVNTHRVIPAGVYRPKRELNLSGMIFLPAKGVHIHGHEAPRAYADTFIKPDSHSIVGLRVNYLGEANSIVFTNFFSPAIPDDWGPVVPVPDDRSDIWRS